MGSALMMQSLGSPINVSSGSNSLLFDYLGFETSTLNIKKKDERFMENINSKVEIRSKAGIQ